MDIVHSARWNTGHEYGPIDEAGTMGRMIRADSRIDEILEAGEEWVSHTCEHCGHEEKQTSTDLVEFRVRFVDETRQIWGEVTIMGYANMSESEFKKQTLQAYIAGGYDWFEGKTQDVGPYDENNFNPWRD